MGRQIERLGFSASNPTIMSIRGTAGYNLSPQNQFGGPSRDMTSDPSPLDSIREQTSKIEDFLDTLSDPVKPYVLSSWTPRCLRFDTSAHSDSWVLSRIANIPTWQIPTSYWAISDCRNFLRRRASNYHPVEWSASLSTRLQTQYGILLLFRHKADRSTLQFHGDWPTCSSSLMSLRCVSAPPSSLLVNTPIMLLLDLLGWLSHKRLDTASSSTSTSS